MGSVNPLPVVRRAIFLLLVCVGDAFSGTGDSTTVSRSIPTVVLDDAVVFLGDVGGFVTSPLRFTSEDWLATGVVAGGTLVLAAGDEGITEGFGKGGGQPSDGGFFDVKAHYGLAKWANISAALVYLTGLVTGVDDIRITGRLLGTSLSSSGLTVLAMRFLFGRARPESANRALDFRWFETQIEYQSFPSGHTTVAFAFSTVLAERLDNLWARIGLYGAATISSLLRVYDRSHWFSDVVTGAIIGTLAGLDALRRERGRERGVEAGRFSIVPTQRGIHLCYRF